MGETQFFIYRVEFERMPFGVISGLYSLTSRNLRIEAQRKCVKLTHLLVVIPFGTRSIEEIHIWFFCRIKMNPNIRMTECNNRKCSC